MNRIFLIIFSFPIFLFGQKNKIDSLQALLKKDKEDTNAVLHLHLLANEYTTTNSDRAINYYKRSIKLSEKIRWQKGVALSNQFLGKAYSKNATYPLALKFYNSALEKWEKYEGEISKNSLSVNKEYNYVQQQKAAIFASIGSAYKDQGDYNKALEYYIKSLKVSERMGNKNGSADNLVRIGVLYSEMNDYPKSLEKYLEALKVFKELGNKERIALSFGNIGNIYYMLGDYKNAKDYYFKGLKMHQECADKEGISYDLGYVGALYQAEAKIMKKNGRTGSDSLLARAIDYYFKALRISEELGDKRLISIWLGSIGEANIATKNYPKAEEYLNKALLLSDKMGILNEKMQFENALSELYGIKGDYKKSLQYFKQYSQIKDSLFNTEKNKEITKRELNYEFEKKEASTRAEQDKRDAVATAETRKQKLILILVSCLLILVLVIAVSIFRSLHITSKQKLLIEIKNKETEEQKQIIEEKNKEILDSIHYAKRIQTSLLPTEKYIERVLNGKNKGIEES
jgi:tetratricopeptide (TPR) repeat protein